jgi:dUTP pyrophosphatase
MKKGIKVLNGQGTMDAEGRGEVCSILVNLSNENFVIEDKDRISRMIISKHEKDEWLKISSVFEYESGVGGFEHTDKR